MLSEIRDTDEIFKAWEASIDSYYRNLEALTIAEANYQSVMAQQIKIEKVNVGATLAKDVAKGSEGCVESFKALGEAERKVKAGREKLEFLKELNVDRRMKEREAQKISGG